MKGFLLYGNTIFLKFIILRSNASTDKPLLCCVRQDIFQHRSRILCGLNKIIVICVSL